MTKEFDLNHISIVDLEVAIIAARDAYYNSESEVSDAEYDAWCDELTKLKPDSKALTQIGAPSTSEWAKMTHPSPLGSLEKFNTPEEVADWVATKLNNGKVIVSEKLDGISIGCIYETGKLVAGITRGDGITGDNILTNVVKMRGAVKELHPANTFSGTVRGEIILTKSNHQAFFSDKANPRNAAAGVSRRFDGVGSEHLTLMMYDVMPADDTTFATESAKFDWLTMNQFQTSTWKECRTTDEIAEMWQEYQDKTRDALDYEIDGLVICTQDIKLQQQLGEHNLKPKFRRAFKFLNQFIKTTVKKVVWDVGGSGRITPVCWFDPVNILGSTIEKAFVYNAAYIKKLGIGVGAEVLVCKCNDIIPRCERVIVPADEVASPPDFCPFCDTKTQMQGEYLICPNRDCKPQVVGRIARWVGELNILELGDTLIEKLVSDGLVKTPADLYTLTIEQLAKIDRMGKKSATNVYNSIWSRNPVPLDLFLGSLSIPLIGSAMIRMVMDAGYDSLSKIRNEMTQLQLEAIHGFGAGSVKAAALYGWLEDEDNQELIFQLLANGVKIKEKVMGTLNNASFCFTGKSSLPRKELQQLVLDNGGVNKSGVGKGLDYLVLAEEDSQSTKAVRARSLGTKCISEAQFMEMIEE